MKTKTAASVLVLLLIMTNGIQAEFKTRDKEVEKGIIAFDQIRA